MKNNNGAWPEKSPYNRFFDFIAAAADRYAILLELIETLGLNPTVIQVAGNRHIFIFPPWQKSLRSSGGVFPFKGKDFFLLSAHYDRVNESPGANDNSISVFHLLKAATVLVRRKVNFWAIVFTDKEELNPGESFENQGAFTLAKKLITWGLDKARIFNFDVCGSGNAFVFSTTTDIILKDSGRPNVRKVRKNIGSLRNHALKTARSLHIDNVFPVPTPFSDDVGFLRAGLAAQTITILPLAEALGYDAFLRSHGDFPNQIISGGTKDPSIRKFLPKTWLSLNSAQDTHLRLTPEFFEQVVSFAVELCR